MYYKLIKKLCSSSFKFYVQFLKTSSKTKRPYIHAMILRIYISGAHPCFLCKGENQLIILSLLQIKLETLVMVGASCNAWIARNSLKTKTTPNPWQTPLKCKWAIKTLKKDRRETLGSRQCRSPRQAILKCKKAMKTLKKERECWEGGNKATSGHNIHNLHLTRPKYSILQVKMAHPVAHRHFQR